MSEYSKEFLDLLESVTAKRPRTVIQHILQHGYITYVTMLTRRFRNKYGMQALWFARIDRLITMEWQLMKSNLQEILGSQ